MLWFDLKFDASSWPSDDLFFEEARENDGAQIVRMSVACPGYWDLEFENGKRLEAVHTVHIIPVDEVHR